MKWDLNNVYVGDIYRRVRDVYGNFSSNSYVIKGVTLYYLSEYKKFIILGSRDLVSLGLYYDTSEDYYVKSWGDLVRFLNICSSEKDKLSTKKILVKSQENYRLYKNNQMIMINCDSEG